MKVYDHVIPDGIDGEMFYQKDMPGWAPPWLRTTVRWSEHSQREIHYVLVDDKLRVLDAIKRVWGDQVTTVFPRQGHYAHDPKILANYPPGDLTVERIGDLLRVERQALTSRRVAGPRI